MLSSPNRRLDRRGYNLQARYAFFLMIIIVMFLYLVWGLINLQLKSGDDYSKSAEDRRTTKITLRGSRGMITDADAVILAKLLEHCFGGVRHDGLKLRRNFVKPRNKRMHNRAQALCVFFFKQRPGGHGVYIFVQPPHQFPQGLKPMRELCLVKQLQIFLLSRKSQIGNCLVVFHQRPRLGHLSLEVFLVHGQNARKQVAQVVGEVRIVACD